MVVLMTKEPHTLDQLPASAAVYYEQSLAPGLFTYEARGKDAAGRDVYQKFLGGAAYGEPQALLHYKEYAAAVKRAAAHTGPHVGVPRWTAPFK